MIEYCFKQWCVKYPTIKESFFQRCTNVSDKYGNKIHLLLTYDSYEYINQSSLNSGIPLPRKEYDFKLLNNSLHYINYRGDLRKCIWNRNSLRSIPDVYDIGQNKAIELKCNEILLLYIIVYKEDGITIFYFVNKITGKIKKLDEIILN